MVLIPPGTLKTRVLARDMVVVVVVVRSEEFKRVDEENDQFVPPFLSLDDVRFVPY